MRFGEMNSIHEDRLKKRSAEISSKDAHRNFVVNTSGKWPLQSDSHTVSTGITLTRSAYEMAARELGYINGYRYGVEYPTNGKKPDLPDDFNVCINGELSASGGDSVAGWDWGKIKSFRIADQRYKPADTSYLVSEISESKSNAENVSDWYDYEAQRAVTLPPVGVECQYLSGNGKWDSCRLVFVTDYVVVIEGLASGAEKVQIAYNLGYWPDFRPLDYNRKAEAEKYRVTSAALQAYMEIQSRTRNAVASFDELYDAGFLRMPAE